MARLDEDPDVWRILLFGRCGEELLLLRNSSGCRLPELRIPRGQRIAPNLNAEVQRVWNLDAVCLLPLEVANGGLAKANCKYHVMELRSPEELASVAPNFMPMSALREESFADVRDYLAVQRGMRLESARSQASSRSPFSQFGAFAGISAWVEEQLRPFGLRLDGHIRQLQATASFALIRFATNRGAVWFKAVGDPNLREFSVTRSLTTSFPQFVPELLAVRTDWNAWLTQEAPGQGLFETSDSAAWCRAAEMLAELQIASLHHTSELLAAGVHDVRSQKLLNAVAPFFLAMEEIMRAQTKTTVLKLTNQEIRGLREHVTEALYELEEHGLPNALNHLDLNPCNIIVSPSGCTFLDWAQAAVGNPFFSLEYLRQQFLQVFPGRVEAEQGFVNAYLGRWKPIRADDFRETLLPLVPLTAAFAFAAFALPWDDPKISQRPELAAFLRSLVRRMRRESDEIRASRAA
jgi:hypothetical protein